MAYQDGGQKDALVLLHVLWGQAPRYGQVSGGWGREECMTSMGREAMPAPGHGEGIFMDVQKPHLGPCAHWSTQRPAETTRPLTHRGAEKGSGQGAQ